MHLSPTLRSPNLRRLAVGAATLAVAAGAGGVSAGTAAAANATLAQGQSAYFPTWFLGYTTICVDNVSATPGIAHFTAPGSSYTLKVPARGRDCISKPWWGFKVNVQNVSIYTTTLKPFNYNGPY
jgi:hypothetical protein